MKVFVALCLLCLFMVALTQDKCISSRPCPRVYDPLCGSDGRTYGNWCLFKAQLQECNPELDLLYCGACHKF